MILNWNVYALILKILEQLLLDEYEKVLMEEEALFGSEWEEQVICPVCELAALREGGSGKISCARCKTTFSSVQTIASLKQSILDSIDYHQQNCDQQGQFAVITDNLFLICEACGWMYQVV